MINFRFHLVSLIAVFLAIGIGIAMGASFMDVATVDAIRGQLDRLEDNYRERGIEIDEWKSQTRDGDVSLDTLFLDDSALLSGRLQGRRIVLISATEAPTRTIDALWEVLGAADAQRAGEIRVGDGSSLSDPDIMAGLRELVPGLGASASADPVPVVMEELGAALAALSYSPEQIVVSKPAPGDGTAEGSAPSDGTGGPGVAPGGDPAENGGDGPTTGPDRAPDGEAADPQGGPATGQDTTTTTVVDGDGAAGGDGEGADAAPTQEDLVRARELIDGLIALRIISLDVHGSDPDALFPEVPGVSYVMLGTATPGGFAFRSLRHLATAVATGAPAVLTVVDGGDPRPVGKLDDADHADRVGIVDALREDTDLDGRLSTVDGIEELTARVAIVLALEEQATGRTGHYGKRDGAGARFPTAAPR